MFVIQFLTLVSNYITIKNNRITCSRLVLLLVSIRNGIWAKKNDPSYGQTSLSISKRWNWTYFLSPSKRVRVDRMLEVRNVHCTKYDAFARNHSRRCRCHLNAALFLSLSLLLLFSLLVPLKTYSISVSDVKQILRIIISLDSHGNYRQSLSYVHFVHKLRIVKVNKSVLEFEREKISEEIRRRNRLFSPYRSHIYCTPLFALSQNELNFINKSV